MIYFLYCTALDECGWIFQVIGSIKSNAAEHIRPTYINGVERLLRRFSLVMYWYMQTLAVHYAFVWLKAKRLLFNYRKITKEPNQKCILDIIISMIEVYRVILTSTINMLKFVRKILIHLNSFHFERCLIKNWKLWSYVTSSNHDYRVNNFMRNNLNWDNQV